MKLQDIGFFIVLAMLLVVRKPIWFAYAGLLCFTLAIPLFAKWVFFTGERLVWYGAGLIFMFLFFQCIHFYGKE